MFDPFFSDLYKGLKREWICIPWTVLSVVALWVLVVAIYFLVYPRLALAVEVQPIKKNVEYILARQFDSDIISTAQMACKNENSQFFVNRLIELKREYKEFTSLDYPELPPCERLK